METPIGLDEESFGRVAEATRRIEALPPRRDGQQRPHRGSQAAPHNWVKVTSDVLAPITLSNGSMFGYPSTWSYMDSSSGGFVDTPNPAWLVTANGEIPFIGTRYEVRCVGADASGQAIWSCDFLKGFAQYTYLATTPSDARPDWYTAYGGPYIAGGSLGYGPQPASPISVVGLVGGAYNLPRADLCFGVLMLLYGQSGPTAVSAPYGTVPGSGAFCSPLSLNVSTGDVWLVAPYISSTTTYGWIAKQLASPFAGCIGYTTDTGSIASIYVNDGIVVSKTAAAGCSGHPSGSGSASGSGFGTGPTFLNLCVGQTFNASYTLTISGGCAALNGTYTITWDGANWTWTGTISGHTVTWNLHDAGGTPSPGVQLSALISGSGNGGYGVNSGYTCPPSFTAAGTFAFLATATFCPGAVINWSVA